MAPVLHLESTPLSRTLEDGFKRSIFIQDKHNIGRERILAALNPIAPQFRWKVANLRDHEVLVDGPEWWKEKALRKEVVKIENEWLGVRPWHEFIEGGFKLKSLWIKIVDFPRKFWCLREFQRLVKEFGVVLEVDQATMERLDLSAAKIRVGVPDVKKIPAYTEAIFPAENGELRWKRVRFVVETAIEPVKTQHKRRRVWVKRGGDGNANRNDEKGAPSNVPEGDNEHEEEEEEPVDYDGDWGEEANANDVPLESAESVKKDSEPLMTDPGLAMVVFNAAQKEQSTDKQLHKEQPSSTEVLQIQSKEADQPS